MGSAGICKGCGSYAVLFDDEFCIFCEPTKEIKIKMPDIDDDHAGKFAIKGRCPKCFRPKKWVVIEVRKGPEFICTKCG